MTENTAELPFEDLQEKIFRSVKPKELYWDSNGRITSCVFDLRKDEAGVSFDRACGREDQVCCALMHKRLRGKIVSITVDVCSNIYDIRLQHSPSPYNYFHSELFYLTDDDNKLKQIKHQLAVAAICEPF